MLKIHVCRFSTLILIKKGDKKLRNLIICFCIVSIMLATSGCAQGSGEQSVQSIAIDQAKLIQIHNGSIAVELESADIQEMEVQYGKKFGLATPGGVSIDQHGEEISIQINSPLASIGQKPKLLVRIPSSYEGDLRVDSSSGNVTFTRFKNKDVTVDTKSGNVKFDFAQFRSNVHVSTVSGDVQLKFNTKEPDVQIRTKTVSGKYSISVPIQEDYKQNNGLITGKSGKGTYELDIVTTSGNITLQ